MDRTKIYEQKPDSILTFSSLAAKYVTAQWLGSEGVGRIASRRGNLRLVQAGLSYPTEQGKWGVGAKQS